MEHKKIKDKFNNTYQITRFTSKGPWILDFVNPFGLAFYEGEFDTIEEVNDYIKDEEKTLEKV